MIRNLFLRYKASWWQAAFLISGLTWLLAPGLNHTLSGRTTMISQYETPLQVFSSLYRTGDIIAALLLLGAIFYLHRTMGRYKWWLPVVMFCIGGLMLIDPIVTTDCIVRAATCLETSSLSSLIHDAESLILAGLLFAVAAFDAIRKRRFGSTMYVLVALAYLAVDISLTQAYRLETLSQYTYQVATIIWVGWFVTRFASHPDFSALGSLFVRRLFASWAYLNGALAIIISLAHIHLFGFAENLYFGYDTAWLAQHGVIIGLVLLYISRHLWRGERRAYLLFMSLLLIECLKYAVVVPHAGLVMLYGLSFIIVAACGQAFQRGSELPSWHARLHDITNLLVAAGLVIVVALGILAHEPKRFDAARQAGHHFSRYVMTNEPLVRQHHASPLLAHTMAVFLSGLILLLLWSLFRPRRNHTLETNQAEAVAVLRTAANSSEDHFKVWPADKAYFWSADRRSFVAYRVAGTVVYALADPVAPTDHERSAILTSFIQFWQAKGYRICFMIINDASKTLYETAALTLTQVGSNAVVTTTVFSETTMRNKWWRWQMNRAKKAGFTYAVATPPHSDAFIAQLKAISDAWLTRPGHEERGFALGDFSQSYMQASTIHYVSDDSGVPIAFANQITTYNGLTQTTIDLMRFMPDINNVMPFLIASTITQLRAEGTFDRFDLGFVPLANMRGRLAKIVRLLAASKFSSSGLEQFKNKFEPEWQDCYIAYDGDLGDLPVIALNLEKVMTAQNNDDAA